MKILFIASRFPLPVTKGDQARVLNSLKYLSKKHEIYFLCTAESAVFRKDINHLRKFVRELHVFRLGRLERYTNLILSPLSLLPFEVMFFHSRQLARKIREVLNKTDIDLVYCQMIRTAPYGERIKGLPKVLDFQDAYSLNMEKRSRSEKGLVKWVSYLEWQLLKRYEKKLLKEFDLTTVVSKRDQEQIGPASKVRVVPIGVEPGEGGSKTIPGRLVFSGNLRYFPNRDAITWFVRNVWPLVKKSHPKASLQIVGANPTSDVKNLADRQSIEVVASPIKMGPYLATASLALAPMRSGSGTQFKVLEALAVGTPVLVTSYARGGLDFLTSSGLLETGLNPKEMATKILELLKDPKRLNKMGQLGRTEVEKYYTWKVVTTKLEAVLTEAKENFTTHHLRDLLRWKILPAALLLIALMIGGLLRFYQIDSNVYFGGDEGRDIRVTQQMLDSKKPLLQGPPTSITTDIGRVYYGPGYYYVLAPVLALTNGDPASSYFVTAFFGTMSILLIYLVGLDLLGRRGALVSAALYAISPYVVGFERWAWSPNWIPFFTLLLIYGLIKAKQKKRWGIYLIALALGIGWQLHYTFLGLVVPVAIVLWRFKSKLILKHCLGAGLVFLLVSSPLLINEFRYGFPNSKVFIYYLLHQDKPNIGLLSKIQSVWEGSATLVTRALGDLGIISWLVAILSAVSLGWHILWNKYDLTSYLMALWPAAVIIPVVIMYSGDIAFDQRFVMALLPWIFLMTGLAVEKLKKEVVVLSILGVLLSALVFSSLKGSGLISGNFFNSETHGLADMKRAVEYMKTSSNGQPVNFDYHPEGGTYPDGYLAILDWKKVKLDPRSNLVFSLYEKDPGNIGGVRFGQILVVKKVINENTN